VLKSDDEQLLNNNEWNLDGDFKFLNQTAEQNVESMNNVVVYTSYPRMGSSFLRKYLSMVTGIATGCEMSVDITFS
jgi:hypothetical protein